MRTFDSFAFNRAKLEKQIVVLDFHSKWCPICRSGSPILEKVLSEKRFSDAIGFLVDYRSKNRGVSALKRTYDVVDEMTVLVLFSGRELERVTGDIRHEALADAIEKAILKARAGLPRAP